MSATTIKLSQELRQRVERLVRGTGKSMHAFMLDAIEQQTSLAERRKSFVADALAARKEANALADYQLQQMALSFRDHALAHPGEPFPVAVALGVVVLGEPFTASIAAGFVLIALGLSFATRRPASPNCRDSIAAATAASADGRSRHTVTPLPSARPSALTTIGAPRSSI